MRYSQLFPKASKSEGAEHESANHNLLTRAGYIHKEAAGVYSFLPLGTRVLRKIQDVIRSEMNAIGSQELILPVISPIELWQTTKRDDMNVLFHVDSRSGQGFVLNPTTEEVITPLVKQYIKSYRDLPVSLYQMNNKFRDELRAKSGILRGREFMMKDAYSFHESQEDLQAYYDIVTETYFRIFRTLGLGDQTVLTFASGGDFSKYSHEFQTVCPIGEDTIYRCGKCNVAVNKEIIGEQQTCPSCDSPELIEQRGVEVGNIFQLGNRFTTAFDLTFRDRDGREQHPVMGCYGIGPSRTMGTIVELSHDERGIKWPKSVAPFDAHMVVLGKEKELLDRADDYYHQLQGKGQDVVIDDRDNVSNGEKLATADLLGVPTRIVVSKRLGSQNVEVKDRHEENAQIVSFNDYLNR
jgi:prolyl-tRNA synthetase